MATERQLRLSVIIVSANSASWLRPCLTTLFARAGKVNLDVVVVAAGCTDDTVALVEREFPRARTISCDNLGFAHANNCGLRTVDADWVLFLNPDTEILDGTLADLIERLDSDPTVGLVGVRQVTSEGRVSRTIRRFPNASRTFFEALGSEHFPFRASWLGERELDLGAYDREVSCDWTSGSFMLALGSAPERRIHGRALLPLLRGDRPLPPDQAGRLGDPASPLRHDPASGEQSGTGTPVSTRRPHTRSVGTSGSTCPRCTGSQPQPDSFSGTPCVLPSAEAALKGARALAPGWRRSSGAGRRRSESRRRWR